MSKKMKILIAVTALLLILVFGGGYVFISSKITPESVRAQLEEHLRNLFPNGNISVGQVSYSLGFSVYVEIDRLEGHFQEQSLFNLKNISVSVPIFSILRGGGSINISMEKPALYYTEAKGKTNWAQALGDLVPSRDGPPRNGQGSSKGEKEGLREGLLALPVFLRDSTLNVDLRGLSLIYKQDNKKNEVTVDKLLLKEVGINSFLSFELDSLFHLTVGEGKKLQFRFVSIGEMKIREFFEKSVLPISVLIKISDIKAEGMPYNIEEVQSKIDLILDHNAEAEGRAEVTYREANSLRFRFRLQGAEAMVEDISSSFSMSDLMEMASINMAGLNVGETTLTLEGKASLKGGKVDPTIKIRMGAPGPRYTFRGIETQSVLSAEMTGKDILVATETNMLGGAIVSETRALLKRDDLGKGMAAISNMNSKININNVKLEEGILRGLFVSKAPKKKEVSQEGLERKQELPGAFPVLPFPLPPVQVKIMLNDNALGEAKIGGALGIRSRRNHLELEKSSRVNVDRGSLNLGSSVRKNAGGLSMRFSVTLRNVDARSFRAFLPQYVGEVKGIFNGSLLGTATQSDGSNNNYDVSVNVAARDGAIERLDISSSLSGLMASLPLDLGEKIKSKSIKVDPDFGRFRFRARLRESHYQLRDIYFLGLKNRVEIKGKGHIYPLGDRKGEIMLNYHDGTGNLDAFLRDVGVDSLPLRFTGVGKNLSPDYGHTVKTLGERYVKNKGKAEVKKAVEKGVKKILDGNKLKGLLDGFL